MCISHLFVQITRALLTHALYICLICIYRAAKWMLHVMSRNDHRKLEATPPGTARMMPPFNKLLRSWKFLIAVSTKLLWGSGFFSIIFFIYTRCIEGIMMSIRISPRSMNIRSYDSSQVVSGPLLNECTVYMHICIRSAFKSWTRATTDLRKQHLNYVSGAATPMCCGSFLYCLLPPHSKLWRDLTGEAVRSTLAYPYSSIICLKQFISGVESTRLNGNKWTPLSTCCP